MVRWRRRNLGRVLDIKTAANRSKALKRDHVAVVIEGGLKDFEVEVSKLI